MKTLIFAVAAFLLMVPVSACKAQEEGGSPPATAMETAALVIESGATHEKHRFTVELATTPEQMMRGLMFRKSMPEDHGMAFLFGEEKERNFWMKNTYIPLDILFIKATGTISHIHENAKPLDETGIPSEGPALTVVELNGGVTAKLGIKPGDIVYMEQAQ